MATGRVFVSIVAILVMPSFGAPNKWVKADAGATTMCAGVNTGTNACVSVETCTYHAIGPCGGLTKPAIYIEANIANVALLKNKNTYLTDSTKMQLLTPSNVQNNGYQKIDQVTNLASAPGAGFNRITTGAFYGSDPAKMGVFIGMAAYMMQKGEVKTNMATVFQPAVGGTRTNVPTVDVCISDLTGGKCGAKRTFESGDYKFSLMARTVGTNFQMNAGFTHIGIRTKYKMVGADVILILNDGTKTLATIGSENVKNMILMGKGGRQVKFVFPSKYNRGDATTNGVVTPAATEDVTIHVSLVTGKANEIYVDYVFKILTAKDKYIIYDPTLTDGSSAKGGVSSYSSQMSLLIPQVIAFVVGCLYLYL
jgi:hypothetical protein